MCTQKKFNHKHETQHECSLARDMQMIKILTPPLRDQAKSAASKSEVQLGEFKRINAHAVALFKLA